MTFCTRCATRLGVACPRCELENPPDASFCGGCAAALATAPGHPRARPVGAADAPPRNGHAANGGARTATQPHPRAEAEGERRQLTVMFCDVVDSTTIAERLDPEDLRDVLRAYQTSCAAVIARHGGCLAKYLGDGVLAYFGYPLAHEDDGARAARAALEIVREMGVLRARVAREHDLDLAVRVALHTGVVVTGEMGGGDHRDPLAIVGEAPNVAARLQSIAAPNEIVASAATFELIQGLFDCDALGNRALKGVRDHVWVYRIRGETGARSRLETVEPARLTALVGRAQEIALLDACWEQVRAGRGRVVSVSGEAGIGKSRLVRVLADRIAAEPHTWLEAHCSPYFQSSALRPLIDLLLRRLACTPDAPAEERVAALESVLRDDGVRVADVLPPLAALLGIPAAPGTAITTSPARQKQQTLDALLGWIDATAAVRPVVLVIEDLHWIDPSTLELLSLLDRPRACGARADDPHEPARVPAAVGDARARDAGHVEPSRPRRGDDDDRGRRRGSRAAARRARASPRARRRHPAFRRGAHDERYSSPRDHGGEGATHATAIPATLHDSLTARLDRLTAAKPVAQLAAVARTRVPPRAPRSGRALGRSTPRRTRSTSSSRATSSSSGACLRTRPTCSSTRSSRRPRTTRCCGARGRTTTTGSRARSVSASPRPPSSRRS